MLHLFYQNLLIGALLMSASTIGAAQDTSYDQNALRFYESTGNIRIVRGISDSVIASIGTFRKGSLTKVVSGSPNAVAEAEIFERNYRTGAWVAAAGVLGLGAWIFTSRVDGVNQGLRSVILVASLGTMLYGAGRLEEAYKALSKAIWWYNRDLKR